MMVVTIAAALAEAGRIATLLSLENHDTDGAFKSEIIRSTVAEVKKKDFHIGPEYGKKTFNAVLDMEIEIVRNKN